MLDAMPRVNDMFGNIIDEMLVGVRDRDFVRLVFNAPQLDRPVSLPFIRRDQMNHEAFAAKLEATLQSHEEITLDENVDFNVLHMAMPEGGRGSKKKFLTIKERLFNKRSIIRMRNKDNMCCPRAIVTGICRIEKHPNWHSIRQGYKEQREYAVDMYRQAGIPVNSKCGIEEIKKFEQTERMSNYRVVLVSKEHLDFIIYAGPDDREHNIYLYVHDEHYDLITSMSAFYDKCYFCDTCFKGYNVKDQHTCINACKMCRSGNCPPAVENDVYQRCEECHRNFKNKWCFEEHRKNKVCERYFQCEQCQTLCSRVLLKKFDREHICGQTWCKFCRLFVNPGHKCHIQPEDPFAETEGYQKDEEEMEEEEEERLSDTLEVKKTKVSKFVFFDFECTQDTGRHIPNYCVAQKACGCCADRPFEEDCRVCGKAEEKQFVFQGPNTGEDFCKWAFGSEDNRGATFIAHNFKSYDGIFIQDYLYSNCIIPKLILAGGKIMSMRVPFNAVRFIDSLNFLAMPLSGMPATFGVEELKKGFFPHLFNTDANMDYRGAMPAAKYYCPDGMSTKKREEFLAWYDGEVSSGREFIMSEEIRDYCVSDVDILRRCCLQFRTLFMEVSKRCEIDSGIDPLSKCITIAAACHFVFRRNFLSKNTIGIIPPQGYAPNDIQSNKAIRWLTHVAEKEQVYIRHARNEGEVSVGKYKLDGYCEENKTVYEFNGCFWHGCSKCYSFDTDSGRRRGPKRTMGELHLDTLEKKRYVKNILKDWRYVTMWECDWNVEEQTIPRHIIQTLPNSIPLDPREAFYGGRTNASCLLYECQQGEQIKYVDFTSLYPSVNKYGSYPLGHPKVITENFKDVSEYYGFIRCKVLPPQNLFHPVLPIKVNGKLMFPLCRTCSESNQQTLCHHSDEERMLRGTWVSLELQKAVEMGYRISNIESVWHFSEKSKYNKEGNRPIVDSGLFTEYINTFLKIKQEASGWPDWCRTEEDKAKYIADYQKHEGIKLDPEKIKKNKGLRSLSKLMLNSFWGRFGMRNNLPNTQVVFDPAKFYELLTSDEIEINDVNFVNDDVVEVRTISKDKFEKMSPKASVVIAAFTTAQARLKLFEVLHRLGERVIYYDTDSIVYIERAGVPGEWCPPLGDYLGELTDELDGKHITSFISGGPKNYAYKLNTNETTCKVKGITLNFRNSQVINFETMKQMVQQVNGDNEVGKITVTNPYQITRVNKKQRIETRVGHKDYRIVYDKRVIRDDFFTIPYGYLN